MLLSNKVTLIRIFLSPLFFIIYVLPSFLSRVLPNSPLAGRAGWTVPVLWILFIGAAITDMLDGMIARKRNEESDFGRLFDPIADTLMQITCFLCYVIDGIFPALLYLLVLYREFGILFVRNLMMKKGIAMGARMGGKLKTVAYILAGGVALVAVSMRRLGFLDFLYPQVTTGALVIFIIAVILAVISFFDYVSVYRNTGTGQ